MTNGICSGALVVTGITVLGFVSAKRRGDKRGGGVEKEALFLFRSPPLPPLPSHRQGRSVSGVAASPVRPSFPPITSSITGSLGVSSV